MISIGFRTDLNQELDPKIYERAYKKRLSEKIALPEEDYTPRLLQILKLEDLFKPYSYLSKINNKDWIPFNPYATFMCYGLERARPFLKKIEALSYEKRKAYGQNISVYVSRVRGTGEKWRGKPYSWGAYTSDLRRHTARAEKRLLVLTISSSFSVPLRVKEKTMVTRLTTFIQEAKEAIVATEAEITKDSSRVQIKILDSQWDLNTKVKSTEVFAKISGRRRVERHLRINIARHLLIGG